jgi:diamine N-acetyltransferase
MNDIIIRKATKKDLSELYKLDLKLYQYHEVLGDMYRIGAKAEQFMKEDVAKMVRSRTTTIFIAEIDSKLVGMAAAKIHKTFPGHSISRVGEVSDIYILPAYRKKDVASKLLGACDSWFVKNNIHELSVTIYDKNTEATAFWKKKGYTKHPMFMLRRELK